MAEAFEAKLADQTFVDGRRSAQFRQSLDLIWTLVRRDLKVKYRGSVLGYLWSMLNPLLFMLTISFVFSFMMKGIPNYPLYVLAGILFWNLAANAISMGVQAIRSGAGLLKKVRMAIWILPVVPVITFAVNFLLALVPFSIIALFRHLAIPDALIYLPVVFVLFLAFLIGISLALATLNVFFRDVGHVVEPVLGILVYATPVIYDRSNPAIPQKIRLLLGINPFTHFIEAGRKCIFGGGKIMASQLLLLAALAGISLLVGALIYRRNRPWIIFGL